MAKYGSLQKKLRPENERMVLQGAVGQRVLPNERSWANWGPITEGGAGYRYLVAKKKEIY